MNTISTDVTEIYPPRHESEQITENNLKHPLENVLRMWNKGQPLIRLNQPKDLANSVYFMTSETSYVNGTASPVATAAAVIRSDLNEVY